MKTIKNLKAEEIRKSILQLAIQGKLVKQNPNDEPASELVKKIYAEKQKLIKEGKIKKDKNESYIFKGDDNCYYEKIGNNEPVKLENLPFDIPNNWTWVRQKNICWLENGEKQKGESLPYLEAKVIRGLKKPQKTDNGVLVDESYKVILVDGENSGEIMTPPFKGYMGSTFKIFSATKLFNYDFLLFIFTFNKEKYKNSKIGAAIPHLNKELFKESYIAVPPFEEQLRIVKKINSFEPLITQYSIAEEKLSMLEKEFPEKLKKSILQYAIEGKLVKQDPNDEPASVLLERIKAEKEKLIKEGKIKRDKNESYIYQGDDKNYYENLPKNWCLTTISEITNSYIGLTYKPTDVANNGIIVLRSSNIQNGKLNLNDIVRVSCKVDDKLLVKNNDIIICARNGSKRLVGKSAIVDNVNEKMTFGVFMAICKTFFYEYVYVFLQSPLFFSQLAKTSGTTTINQLTQKAFNAFFIPLPPVAEQKRIKSKIDYIFKYIDITQ